MAGRFQCHTTGHGLHCSREVRGGVRQDAPFIVEIRVVDDDVEHEPIELRFRQRVRALLLDRVLGGQHKQGPLELVPDPAHRDLILLHGLEQGRLRAWRSAVDLVGKDDVGEDRAGNEADLPLAGSWILFDDLGAEDVRRHQVWRELDATEPQVDRVREGLDQEGLGQTGNPSQQAVSPANRQTSTSRRT